jgi:glutaredoxin 3
MMFKVYGIPFCPFCDNAKRLLDHKNVAYVYKDVTKNEEDKKFVDDKSVSKTFPQIFNDTGEFIGGFTELKDYLKAS